MDNQRGRLKEQQKCVVPWYNPEQFHKVYEYIYSPELTKKRWAVDQLSVWDSRCYPSLPMAVEATLVLTRAIIQDVLFSNGTTLCQESDIELLYSMALVRFVNLTVEILPHRSSNATVARQLGIPEWIVDLRNAAAHSFTPSLAVLRMGADVAMKFLDLTYWSLESKNLKNIVKEPEDFEEMKDLILNFQVYQYKLLGRKNKQSYEFSQYLQFQKRILKVLSLRLCSQKDQVIEILVMDGFFISLEDDLKLMLTEREIRDFYNEDPEGDGSKQYADDEIPHHMPVLPDTLEQFWAPVLHLLTLTEAMHDFVEALLYSQANRDETGQRLLASWVIKILVTAINTGDKPVTPLAKIFHKQGPLFEWERLLHAVLAKPCIYTPFIFPLIACHLDLEEDYARSLMNLLAISQGQALDPGLNLPANHVAFTVEKFKQSKKLQEMKIPQKKKKDTSIWSVASDNIDFRNIPIGTVFKSSSDDDSQLIDFNFNRALDEDLNYTEKLIWGNKNDEDMEDFVTIEQNTFMEDKKLIGERETFMYRK